MNKNIIACMGLSFCIVNAMLGTDISITNETAFPAKVNVIYGAFCSNDYDQSVAPGQTIRIPAGSCLIVRIGAQLTVSGKTVIAKRYRSSGTGYRTFKIIKTGENSFAVVRP